MKPFYLEAALRGEKVVTRDGKEILEIKEFNRTFKLAALIKHDDGECTIMSFNKDGSYFTDCEIKSEFDLFMAPTKNKGWINVYKNFYQHHIYCDQKVYKSKNDALNNVVNPFSKHILTAEIEWEE